MKSRISFNLILICCCFPFCLTSCLFGDFGAQDNSDAMLKLKIGDSKKIVLTILGNPHRNEKYEIENKQYDIWYYRTSHNADGFETDDEFTPVIIIDNKLAGWGRNYYDNSIKIKIENTNK